MKQETGKTNNQKINRLSVQISLSGQAFLYTTVEGVRYGKFYTIDSLLSYIARNSVDEILLFVGQEKHVTIPTELFIDHEEEIYLTAKYSSFFNSVYSNDTDDITIIYPVEEHLEVDIKKLKEMCEVKIHHSISPLIILTKKIEFDNISFSYINNHIFIVAKKDSGIKFVDCFEVEQEDNILDIIEIVIEKLNINDPSVTWIGELSREITDILIKRYNIV